MRRPCAFIAALLSLSSAGPALAQGAVVEHRGRCDASAAVVLDAERFVVADDESNVLRTYRFGRAEAPPGKDVSAELGLRPDDEVDLEGAARLGSLVYWIGSHGANKNGKARPERRRLFATEISAAGDEAAIRVVGTPYSRLVDDLAAFEPLKELKIEEASRRAPKSKDALNVEGLAAARDGKLLVGLRNPLTKAGRAVIVLIDNPDAVIRSGERARLGAPIELDLGGLGIRSLEQMEPRGDYVILAGPIDGEDRFSLFRWPGPGSTAVTPVDWTPPDDFRPEAIAGVPGADEVLIVSDDGERVIGGRRCKKLPTAEQRFQAIRLKLP